ncbi:4365_t:CDS:2 [Acaulospora morrowiae]|uniref:4365_t:CDS:1 n=1 Tax=Acaulospora morrowiae TaxID=94023 RepID=A0A9N9AWF9_9GLOM|nr:4365_t:CDS:2 [Acaulospora morrowiae]
MDSQEDIYNEFRRISKQTYTHESSHLEDLWSIPIKNHLVGDNEYKIEVDKCHLRHMSFIFRAAFDVVLTLLTDWTLPFKHPLYWLYLVSVYPVVLYILFVAEVVSFIVDKFKLKFVKTSVHERWSKYTAPELLFDADFYQKEENRSIVDEGVGALDKPYQEAEKSDEHVQHFNLDIAQFLLFVSDVIYYRSPEKIMEAKKKIDMIKHHPEKQEELLRETVGLLNESDEIIKAQAKKWKLKFISVSELNTLGESHAGIFYSERHDFVVVAFKGPTIDKLESFVHSLLFQHADGRPIVGFEAYNGYRSMLHPETEKPGPYVTIVEAIQNAVRVIRENKPKKNKINIWFTGHSLGGTLATTFYTRCLKSPSDLGEHCVIRDAYVFGNPCVGDSELASTYVSSLNKQSDVVSTLWRVVSDKDIMTSLPFGFYHPGGVGKYNVLDNVHIGEAVKFYQDAKKRPVLVKNPLIPKKNPAPTITSSKPREDQRLEITIHSFDHKLPSFIRDHTTSRYLMGMSIARNHLVDSVKGSTESKGYRGEIALAYES